MKLHRFPSGSLNAGDDVMLTKSKAALAAALVLGSTSLALAQGFDPNLANRYPSLTNPQAYGYVAGANTPTRMSQVPNAALQSAPVHLRQSRHPAHTAPQAYSFQSRDVALPSGQVPFSAEEQWFDRATQSFGGGK
jgi:hypothetical protein